MRGAAAPKHVDTDRGMRTPTFAQRYNVLMNRTASQTSNGFWIWSSQVFPRQFPRLPIIVWSNLYFCATIHRAIPSLALARGLVEYAGALVGARCRAWLDACVWCRTPCTCPEWVGPEATYRSHGAAGKADEWCQGDTVSMTLLICLSEPSVSSIPVKSGLLQRRSWPFINRLAFDTKLSLGIVSLVCQNNVVLQVYQQRS